MKLYTRVHENTLAWDFTHSHGNDYATAGYMNIHKINKFVISCGSTDILLYERLRKDLYTEQVH